MSVTPAKGRALRHAAFAAIKKIHDLYATCSTHHEREEHISRWALKIQRQKTGVGADGGTRTPTLFRITDFKSVASTDSATSAVPFQG